MRATYRWYAAAAIRSSAGTSAGPARRVVCTRARLVAVTERCDTVVVGGGQSGLAVAYELRRAGRSFVVLDAAPRVGDAWRGRWDSLRLFTPAAANGLPGTRFPAPRGHLPSKDEMADFLAGYAAEHDLQVRTRTRVTAVRAGDTGFTVETPGYAVRSRSVVVASGPYRVPYVPALRTGLAAGVHQLHSSEYLNPAQLPPGPVLVAGAGNSGGEIALELAATHRVWFAGRDTGRVPCRVDASLYRLLAHVRTDRGPGRLVAGALAGRGSPLVRAGPAELAAAGVARVPKVTGVTGGRPRLADGRVLDVTTVVWCTGFRHDFGWLPPAAHDGTGAPVHDRGRARHVPGLAFAGLRFQATLASGIVAGAGADARLAVAATAPVS